MGSVNKKKIQVFLFISLFLISCIEGKNALVASDSDLTVFTGDCGHGKYDKYLSYLLDVKMYKRGGETLHNNYRDELLCISAGLFEGQDLQLVKGSVGFYHDRKAGSRTPCYLGFDVLTEYNGAVDYGTFCTRLIRENVGGIAEETRRAEKIFRDSEIAGLVVTFKWPWNNTEGHVTIWIKKDDISAFNEGKITASELYQRSTITNASGQVILLPI